MLVDLTPESILTYLSGLELAKMAGKEIFKAGMGQLKSRLLTKPTYQQRLQARLRAFIDSYGQQLAVEPSGRDVYFWQLAWTWEQLLAYRFYAQPQPLQLADLPRVRNLVEPTQTELTEFSKRLWAALDEDETLRALFVSENYQEAVFRGLEQNQEQFGILRDRLDDLRSAHSEQRDTTADVSAVLDQIEGQLIRAYRPHTAVEMLRGLETHLTTRHRTNRPLLARFHFLLAAAYKEGDEAALACRHAEQAWGLQPEQPLYAEHAALAYVQHGDAARAQQALEALRTLGAYSPIGTAVELSLAGPTAVPGQLAAIPAALRATLEFKQTLLSLVLVEWPLETLYELFAEELRTYATPAALTFDNRRFYASLTMLVLLQEMPPAAYYLTPFHRPARLAASARLQAAYDTLTLYRDVLRSTEKFVQAGPFWFLRGMVGYLMRGDEADFADYQAVFSQQTAAQKQAKGYPWACLMSQWAPLEAVLAVLDQVDAAQDDNAEYLRFQVLQQLDQTTAAEQSLALDVSRMGPLNPETFSRALLYLDLFCTDEDSRASFVAACQARGQLQERIQELLLRAEVWRRVPGRWPEVHALLAEVRTLLTPQLSVIYWHEAAWLYHHTGDYASSYELGTAAPTASGPLAAGTERLLLLNLYHLRRDSEHLRERLAAWRHAHGCEWKLCCCEIELAQLLPDWSRLAEIAAVAHREFADDTRFYHAYLLALHQTGRRDELLPALRTLVESPDRLSHQELLNAATMALREGLAEEALAMVYPLALNPDDVTAREKFVSLLTNTNSSHRPEPLVAAPGTAVQYTISDEPRPTLLLTEQNTRGQFNPVAAKLVGLAPGAAFTVPDRLNGQPLRGRVTAVLSPYTALLHDIMEQSRLQPGALRMKTITLDGPTGNDLRATLLREFGPSGQARQVEIERDLSKYALGALSFSVVAGRLYHGEGLDAYRFLTSPASPGFCVPPRSAFAAVPVTAQLTFVLDWSTLPLLYLLHTRRDVAPLGPLWVSAQLVEQLEQQLRNAQQSPAPMGHLQVVGSAVYGQAYPDSAQQQEIAFLTDLLAWVRQHCQTRLVLEKLDLLRQAAPAWEEDDRADYFDLLLDTAFLANHPETVLISDDTLLADLLLPGGHQISSEIYLSALYPERYRADILPELLDRRYLGLTVESTALFELFVAAGGCFVGPALQYLQSLSLNVGTDVRALRNIHYFLKEVHLLAGLSPAQRSRAAVAVYVTALQHVELTSTLRQRVRNFISHIFRLLPFAEQDLQQDFAQAWQLVQQTRQCTVLG